MDGIDDRDGVGSRHDEGNGASKVTYELRSKSNPR